MRKEKISAMKLFSLLVMTFVIFTACSKVSDKKKEVRNEESKTPKNQQEENSEVVNEDEDEDEIPPIPPELEGEIPKEILDDLVVPETPNENEVLPGDIEKELKSLEEAEKSNQ